MPPQMENTAKSNVLDYESISNEVSQRFTILESFMRSDGAIEYRLSPTENTKEDFLMLWKLLKAKGYVPILKKGETSLNLYVAPYVKQRKKRSIIPIVLFIATVIVLLVDGWLNATSSINQMIFPGWDPLIVTFSYALGFLGILGLHELGHLLISRKRGMDSTVPYFIPGIPGIGFPTLGAIIFATEPMANHDTQFDVGLSGPLSGFLVAIIVGVFGVLTSVSMPTGELAKYLEAGQMTTMNVPIIMYLLEVGFGKISPSTDMVMSPIAYAAWFGFLITFLNALPAWQLDGGHMSSSVLSEGKQKIATLLSAIVMAYLGFTLMAVLVMFFSLGQRSIRPLDDVSVLSKSRKIMFILMIAICILCAPVL